MSEQEAAGQVEEIRYCPVCGADVDACPTGGHCQEKLTRETADNVMQVQVAGRWVTILASRDATDQWRVEALTDGGREMYGGTYSGRQTLSGLRQLVTTARKRTLWAGWERDELARR